MSGTRRAQDAFVKIQETKASRLIHDRLKQFERAAGAAKRLELQEYLSSTEFDNTCQQVFAQVDADKSNSIDPEELAKAFQLVIENLPGASEAIYRAMKSHHSRGVEKAAQELAQEAFGLFDLDQSGTLDGYEFIYACRLMWCMALTWAADLPECEVKLQKDLEEYKNLAGAAAYDELISLFKTFEFSNLCKTVFNQVDVDNSLTLDEGEVFQACHIVANELASTVGDAAQRSAILSSFADDINEDSVKNLFALVDSDGGGTLDEVEFTTTVKLLLVDLYSRAYRAKSGATDGYVSETMTKFAEVLGEERLAFLRQLFNREEFPTECTLAFHRVDVDDSHSLDKRELALALRHILRTSGQVDKLIDAGIDVGSLQRSLGTYLVDRIFEVVDTDGSGKIEVGEFPAVVKLFWVHILRIDALGGENALSALEQEEEKSIGEFSSISESCGEIGSKRSSDAVGDSDVNKRVVLSEDAKTTPAARAAYFTEHPVIQTATESRISESGENEGEREEMQTKIKSLLDLFQEENFQIACEAAFTTVDKDGSSSIEREELAEAFEILLNEIPEAKEKLQSLGVSTDEDHKLARSQLVEGIYEMLAAGESGSLDREQFSLGMRLMWMQLAL